MTLAAFLTTALIAFAGFNPATALSPYKNPTYSPDSSKIAYTFNNDLYVVNLPKCGRSSSCCTSCADTVRLTFDGSETTLNGYASWVYYEEIFGRPSNYRAFWWSPDSRYLAFYSFDDSSVPMFPIYSPFGQDGSLRRTHYPKAGEKNPDVKVCIADLSNGTISTVLDTKQKCYIEKHICYIGTPFWRTDASELVFPVMPRVQQDLELIAASVADGSLRSMYKEHSDTWLDWPESMLFGKNGLYMTRSFETNWEQVYYVDYKGDNVQCLTHGSNWEMQLLEISEDEKIIYFSAKSEGTLSPAVYSLDKKGKITAITPQNMWADNVVFAPDLKSFTVTLSNASTPIRKYKYSLGKKGKWTPELLRDYASRFDLSDFNFPHPFYMTTSDGLRLPAMIAMPRGFNPEKKYPVAMMIYGGPGNTYVRDKWTSPVGGYDDWKWFQENGIIRIIADTRVAGHNGRLGKDCDYLDVISTPVADLVEWAHFLQSQPWVDGEHIGIEGFSFGGAMTVALVLEHPECYCCGIAGGGVYDWMLYDSHYTERFMNTPENNPDGYRKACILDRVRALAAKGIVPSSRLMLTHGTGDDNVHFQNTLQLINELQRAQIPFDLMIYPDALHGYRSSTPIFSHQSTYSYLSDHTFWLTHLFTN